MSALFLFTSSFRHKYHNPETIIKRVMKMSGVIYADVLIVVNIYITYLLLSSTALILKEHPDKLRIFIASFMGGIYSLTVLLPERFAGFLAVLRILAAGIFVLTAFGFKSVRLLLKQGVCFFLCSFVFAGLMFAIWYFICPAGMYFNGAVVYFDIDNLTLVILTVICYGFLRLFDVFFRTRMPVNTMYYLTVTVNGQKYNLKAFLDTGNQLCDPFTGRPVIIANIDGFGLLFRGDDKSGYFEKFKMHYVFCKSLSGKEMLSAFYPDKLLIKGADCSFYLEEATVALTDERLLKGEYDAILPLGIFDNNFVRKDERENEKNEVLI